MEELPRPDSPEPMGLKVAETVIRTGFENLEPDSDLAPHWFDYREALEAWMDGNALATPDALTFFRQAIETICGGSEAADKMLAAMKLSLSGFVLAVSNPYSLLLASRPLWHNDIDAVLRRAVVVCEESLDYDPFYGKVMLNLGAADQFVDENNKQYLRSLIANATWRADQ